VQIAFLEVLQRYPTSGELSSYTVLLDTGSTVNDVKDTLRATDEYKKLAGTYYGTVTYDPVTWKINVDDPYSTNYHGVILGNGKIGLITDASHNSLKHTFISTNFDFNSFGKYTNNVAETFQYNKFHLFSRDPTDITVTNLTQELNMRNGIFKSSYSLDLADESSVSVVSELVPLRQYPYCVLQRVTVTSGSTRTIDLYHDLVTPSNIINVRYGTNVVSTTNDLGQQQSVQFFNGFGEFKENNKPITSSSCYLFPSGAQNKGYNIQRSDKSHAYNKYELSLTAGTPFTFTILTCTMSGFDFDQPEVEATRILINVVSKSVTTILDENLAEWNKMWVSDVIVSEKLGITSEEEETVVEFNRTLRYALYNVYACIRDDINVDINPLNLSTIDLNGHIFWSAELWLIPLLVFFKPKAARTLLDFRYANLEKAKKLASAHGYRGSKFAYENDIVGYNDVYWDTVSPLYIFNTALISVSVWNYFRVTQDIDWLRQKGYTILKNNADFFATKAEYSESDSKYHFNNVLGLNNVSANDNALTNYLAKVALKFAIEATYELNYIVDSLWVDIAENVYMPVENSLTVDGTTYYKVILPNAGYSNETLKFLEPLITLLPYYSGVYFDCVTCQQGFNSSTQIKNNIAFYIDTEKLDPAFEANNINKLILSTLKGTVAQLDGSETVVGEYYTLMNEVISEGTMKPWNGLYNSLFRKTFNDIGVSALFVLSVITSLGALKIVGGINSDRQYYRQYQVTTTTANILPVTWRKLEITGVGKNSLLKTSILNRLIYTNLNTASLV
jgi:hypothetical protein